MGRVPVGEGDEGLDAGETDDEAESGGGRRRNPARRRQAALATDQDQDQDQDETVPETVLTPQPTLPVRSKSKQSKQSKPPPEHSPLPTRAEQLALTDAD